jgi:hypothetical protein
MSMVAFCVAVPCELVDSYQSFGGTCSPSAFSELKYSLSCSQNLAADAFFMLMCQFNPLLHSFAAQSVFISGPVTSRRFNLYFMDVSYLRELSGAHDGEYEV